ncbi:DUF4397 domain-containing protein [Cognaticolwellia beringensis]|uniref:DUF4397 domain-containing protein n=1 Tax=Cognaticolwellia beringensis TaxID=1967665 RepID=A0A222G702_9GAMM|nr:DUF4397 domain-containing protein [Cognaticolwellia beringensis]ASP47677.1 hypothetical protein B5D82_07860 [Cognaticolwellia beringensis]
MCFKSNLFSTISPSKVLIISLALALAACGGSSDSSNVGYVKFYNSSKNAPDIILTLDQDLASDDDDDADNFEVTFNGVAYTEALSVFEIDTDSYFYEMGWQDEDSSDRDDLEVIAEGQIKVTKDTIQLLVLTDDITAPQVDTYSIDVLDDDEDEDNDLFNLRVLNLHPDSAGVDFYMSESDETFNEATLVGQFNYRQLSENQKFDQDEYIFYITKSGTQEVLFTSDDIDYAYPAQYVMIVRENTGSGTSPYAMDRMSNSSITEYLDTDSEAQFRAYNAIREHALIPNYTGTLDIYINGVDDEAEISALEIGSFSETKIQNKGDYSLDLLIPGSTERLLSNHLLSLAENTNKTVFFYLNEEDVDLDGDGNVDENNDGIVDEIEITIKSLVVANSTRESIYDHQITMIDLVDSEDFNFVKFYFVRSDETIETALYSRSAVYTQPESIYLQNNTYQVFAIAEVDSSEVILSSFQLTLDEDSDELFLIVEADDDSPTGYRIEMIKQTEDE